MNADERFMQVIRAEWIAAYQEQLADPNVSPDERDRLEKVKEDWEAKRMWKRSPELFRR